MYGGSLRTTYEWVDGPSRITVDVLAFVSRADPGLAVIRLRLVPRQSGRITVRFSLHEWPPPERLAMGRLDTLPAGLPLANVWYPGHLTATDREADSLSLKAEGGSTRAAVTQSVAATERLRNLHRGSADLSFYAVADEAVSLIKLVGVATSRDGSDPLPRARATIERAAARGYRTVLAEHAAAWKRLWATDVVVEGDPALQRVIHAMEFYLLSSVREDSDESIPPMGLSSGGFYGHVFWDADTWMLPVLAVMQPQMARSIVAFRSRTLEAARRNARAHGFEGAKYPWEADERGEETTPRFAWQNARSEVHISGDVALAQWQYYLATGDMDWLSREGYPVIKETADFWVSRVTHDSPTDRYHIRDVVSVDESLIGIDNDTYTNAVARVNLEIAIAASRKLGQEADPRWAQIAERLFIPYDAIPQIHPPYENAAADVRASAVPLLAYPLALPMSERIKRNDLLHTLQHSKRNGAMMTEVLYPVVAAELGDRGLVDRLLRPSYEGHLRPPFFVLAERPVNDAVNFVTGAGAFLQQVVFGYTGLRLGDDGLQRAFKPLLPAGIRRIVLRNFSVRGTTHDIIVDREGARFVVR
jgi:trehalose/maltose hydrolase-like predicted phosphorylase